MAIDLDGIIFGQIFGDNSSNNDPSSDTEFDSDGDGTATQEDEFVSITNTTGAPMDISGWQIWSDASGTNAPDPEQDGLYHTFPPGSVLEPGETLWIINEITGTPPEWAQEASEGGVESGPGGENTNFLSEGNIKPKAESVALVNPQTGEYIVFNMSPNPPEIQNLPGFPGTDPVGVVDGHSVQDDMAAGFSYQYDEATDSYIYAEAFVPCFAAGTLVATPDGPRAVETLVEGDLVDTLDHGPQPLRLVLTRTLDFAAGDEAKHKPIAFKPGSLGAGLPERELIVSPQHRMMCEADGEEMLAPAKGLTGRQGVRVMQGCRQVTYVQLVFARHEILLAEGAPSESFFPGPYAITACDRATRQELAEIFPSLAMGEPPAPARPLLRVGEARRMTTRAKTQPARLRAGAGVGVGA